MDKWFKGILIGSLVLIAVGGMLAVTGGVFGGRESLDGLVAQGLLQISAAEKQDSGIVFNESFGIWSGDFSQRLDALPKAGAGFP